MSYYGYSELPRWTGALIQYDGVCQMSRAVWSKSRHSWINHLYKKARTCPGRDQWMVEDAFKAICYVAQKDGYTNVFLWPLCTTEPELKKASQRLRQQCRRSRGRYAVLQEPEKGHYHALTTWDPGSSPQWPLNPTLEWLLLEGWQVKSTSRVWSRTALDHAVKDPDLAIFQGIVNLLPEDYVPECKKAGIKVESGWGEYELVPDPDWQQKVEQWQERDHPLSFDEFLDSLPTAEQIVDSRILAIADKVREAQNVAS